VKTPNERRTWGLEKQGRQGTEQSGEGDEHSTDESGGIVLRKAIFTSLRPNQAKTLTSEQYNNETNNLTLTP
jgi:hypothetical protein